MVGICRCSATAVIKSNLRWINRKAWGGMARAQAARRSRSLEPLFRHVPDPQPNRANVLAYAAAVRVGPRHACAERIASSVSAYLQLILQRSSSPAAGGPTTVSVQPVTALQALIASILQVELLPARSVVGPSHGLHETIKGQVGVVVVDVFGGQPLAKSMITISDVQTKVNLSAAAIGHSSLANRSQYDVP